MGPQSTWEHAEDARRREGLGLWVYAIFAGTVVFVLVRVRQRRKSRSDKPGAFEPAFDPGAVRQLARSFFWRWQP
jgi:hypothetical protein